MWNTYEAVIAKVGEAEAQMKAEGKPEGDVRQFREPGLCDSSARLSWKLRGASQRFEETVFVPCKEMPTSIAEICGDDESAQRLRKNASILLAKFPRRRIVTLL